MSSVDPQDGVTSFIYALVSKTQISWFKGSGTKGFSFGFKMAKPTLRKGCVFLLLSGL